MHPAFTHVPPSSDCSTSSTRAPWLAAKRAQRIPAEPPPITTRSSMRPRYPPRMADPAVPAERTHVHAPPSLAEQALTNLVNQFARPLDFVRELVQNAIDAGSPRIAVTVAWQAPAGGERDGVLRLSVEDWGEGMDEAIIDLELTRLFASSKENDLTKIGKFGIGFTSIFALRPEAVLLRTG